MISAEEARTLRVRERQQFELSIMEERIENDARHGKTQSILQNHVRKADVLADEVLSFVIRKLEQHGYRIEEQETGLRWSDELKSYSPKGTGESLYSVYACW